MNRRRELSPYTRGAVVGAFTGSLDRTQIAVNFRILYTTVCDTVNTAPLRQHGQSSSRLGRLKASLDQLTGRIL